MHRSLASIVLLLPIVACSPSQGSDVAGTSPHKLMDGCGMMIDGKMVYKSLRPGEECMNMIKPASMMPNGVTMHHNPS